MDYLLSSLYFIFGCVWVWMYVYLTSCASLNSCTEVQARFLFFSLVLYSAGYRATAGTHNPLAHAPVRVRLNLRATQGLSWLNCIITNEYIDNNYPRLLLAPSFSQSLLGLNRDRAQILFGTWRDVWPPVTCMTYIDQDQTLTNTANFFVSMSIAYNQCRIWIYCLFTVVPSINSLPLLPRQPWFAFWKYLIHFETHVFILGSIPYHKQIVLSLLRIWGSTSIPRKSAMYSLYTGGVWGGVVSIGVHEHNLYGAVKEQLMSPLVLFLPIVH